MAGYGKKSRQSPAKILEMALQFFGSGGLGLKVEKQGEGYVSFEGGGGHVFVQACEKGKGSLVDLETREWDSQAWEFMGRI